MLLVGIAYYLFVKIEEWCDRRDYKKIRDGLMNDMNKEYNTETGELKEFRGTGWIPDSPTGYEIYREYMAAQRHSYNQMVTDAANKLITEKQYQEIKRHQSLYKAKDEDMSSLNDQMKDVP